MAQHTGILETQELTAVSAAVSPAARYYVIRWGLTPMPEARCSCGATFESHPSCGCFQFQQANRVERYPNRIPEAMSGPFTESEAAEEMRRQRSLYPDCKLVSRGV